MPTIAIAGLVNIETTIQVERFPVEYVPVRYPFFGVRSTVAGVGYNVAKALQTLGHDVRLATLLGRDLAGALSAEQLRADGLPAELVLRQVAETAQSAILYDPAGSRQINTDLKDLQEQTYPVGLFEQALASCDFAVICNINFARPLLALARARGVLVATDVHAIGDPDDGYNRDYMAAADVLFLSHERLPCPPEQFVALLHERYPVPVAVVGLGAEGALLAVRADGFVGRFPAASARPVVSTVGAGDALLSAFVHGYTTTRDPYESLRRAIMFAAYKIGAAGAAEGFLSAPELSALPAR